MDDELTEHARSLLDGNAYLTLGTVDADGHPWTTPAYFAADGLADFYWVSSPQARHSRSLAAQPSVSLVVFDSTVAPCPRESRQPCARHGRTDDHRVPVVTR